MMLTKMSNIYHYVMEDLADPRTETWFMVKSPIPLFLLIGSYLYFVIYGQKWMEKRTAYNLKDIMTAYNFCLVLLNIYIFYETLVSAWFNPRFNKACQAVDYSNDPDSLRLANAIWVYYMSKLIELLDTVFFVLRKKNNQITFLHVYHHACMPIWWWQGSKFVTGGETYLVTSLNSFIHIVMYIYYLLAGLGPSMQKYLWWKKYMTKLQLVQFVWFMVHATRVVFINCGFPRAYMACQILFTLSQFVLFLNFYFQTYFKPRKDDPKETTATRVSGGDFKDRFTNEFVDTRKER